jgi:RNA polymerase sigma-70 factor (ECF subfamily)
VTDDDTLARFERLALPHLDAAYNLARWLTRDDHDAQDVVQEACLRAMRYFGSFRGEQARPWLLQTVRHTCWSWLKENRPAELVGFDDDDDGDAGRQGIAPSGDEPHTAALRRADRLQLNQAIAALPIPLREVLVLHDIEDMPYKDIARIVDIPIGTVMSRLSRAREAMRRALTAEMRPTLRPVPKLRGGQS